MDKKETALLLMEIDRFFPGKLKLEGATVEAWYRVMKTQDYKEVIRRLDLHVMHHKYPPTVHDLFEKPRPEHNKNILKQLADWEKESIGTVPVQQKLQQKEEC
ncbi:hypothetical protein J2S74_001870 [Evansella vedderi]|uniref:Replicative helicase inhibitor G39P N-terminal domain-containing protein n=1 Tax=Evansella vedderi TaxID=38282 RepID=A0ABT9ZTB7_9BACI|nr:hypothetical protein [Evansella vedderi]MDQ0254491.1 hypothetical protein [Evansella vedderi]